MVDMRKIILMALIPLTFTSCVEQMEEVESTKVSGAWAIVDDDNLASTYFVFDKGYLYEYDSDNRYFAYEKTLWGAEEQPVLNGKKYRYSYVDGVIHYNNYYEDVQISLRREGDVLTFGDYRCVPIEKVSGSYYSKIILSEDNRTVFSHDDTDIEWTYDIEHPVDGFELTIKEAPQWCGGVEGVNIEDGKISFSILPTTINFKGKFVFSYTSAQDVEVEVMLGYVDVKVDQTPKYFRQQSGSGTFEYTIVNKREGAVPVVKTDVYWIEDIKDDNGRVSYSITQNVSSAARTGKIIVTYAGKTVKYTVIQAAASGYGFWIGHWTLTGENGQKQTVTFSQETQNSTYRMTGYEGLSDDIGIIVNWNNESKIWSIKEQNIGKVDIGDQRGIDLWILGGAGDGKIAPHKDDTICSCYQSSENEQTVKANSPVKTMFLATNTGNDWAFFSTQNGTDYLTFPLTMTPVSK